MKVASDIKKPDNELWKDFRQGSMDAFSEIYTLHIQALNNYGRKLSKNQKLVEDCIQDLFIDIWKSKENLSDTNSIKYYLFKSLRRKIVREGQVSQNIILEIEENYFFELCDSPEALIINQQSEDIQSLKLNEALHKLTKRQREAIYLKFYQDLSFQEVSSVMSLGMKSTYNLISKSVEELRRHLNKNDVFIILVLFLSYIV